MTKYNIENIHGIRDACGNDQHDPHDRSAERGADMNLLTDKEQEALAMSGKLADLCREIVGDGPQAAHDWAEIAADIHHVQHAILAQAAARAFPGAYRLLGESLS